jgi:uncharacterized OsmC-like protein
MAESIQQTDSIEGSGFPLAFKVRKGTGRSGVIGGLAACDVFRVDLRAMGGHQKECVVTEGEAGSSYRLTSDEGASLKGSDLAPFPLGFMSAGFQADLQNRFMTLASATGVKIDALATEIVNGYEFNGSFFRGDGKGSADAPRIKFIVKSASPAATIQSLVRGALDASPLIALTRGAPSNTFALYINGKRRAIAAPPPSLASDVSDPLKVWAGVPRPLPNANDPVDLITKIAAAPAPDPAAPQFGMSLDPAATIRRPIAVLGETTWHHGITQSETWLGTPIGSRFGLKSDERMSEDQAPSGLGLAVSGIAFCLMTQLLRYTEVHKLKIRALRLVQVSPFELTGSAASGTLRARMHPLDTHVFAHGDETDERIEKLLVMAQNTCYLHALLHRSFEPVAELTLNGVAVMV